MSTIVGNATDRPLPDGERFSRVPALRGAFAPCNARHLVADPFFSRTKSGHVAGDSKIMTRACLILITVVAAAGLSCPRPVPLLLWNASASAPLGLYRIDADGRYDVGDLVAVNPPEPLASFLAERGYLARGLPLIKRIQAVAGHSVCRQQLTITVDGIAVGAARRRDSAGRDLPDWQGCRHLASDQLFLMNPQVSDSLDGRYFGVTATVQILGRAVPLWTDQDANGRFEWRAPAGRQRSAAVIAPYATSSPSMDRRPT